MHLSVIVLLSLSLTVHHVWSIKATCHVQKVEGVAENVSGHIDLNQDTNGGEVTIQGKIDGISEGPHGFHIHDGTTCSQRGPHYNPHGKNHGYIGDKSRQYHVGDLGNIAASKRFEIKVNHDFGLFEDSQVSIMGRVMVVHAQMDDLGKGTHTDSLTTGHAGAQLGCCVITESSSATTCHLYSLPLLIVLSSAVVFLVRMANL